MKSKALVTGCAGFIGSHLCEKLLNLGYEVIGIDCFRDFYDPAIKEKNLSNFINSQMFTLIRNDICMMTTFPEVEFVFHLAAQAGVRSSWGKLFDHYTHDNVNATQYLLEGYKESKTLKKFVYSSSSSVYGDSVIFPVNEEIKPQPISPYGVTKLAAEYLCYLYHVNYSLPTVSLRYFSVYGPRQRPDMIIHKIFTRIMENNEIEIFGDGTQIRDFTYIDDVVWANIIASQNGKNGDVYNIGGGNRIQLIELIKRIESIMQKNANISFSTVQKGDVYETYANIQHAIDIGWSPSTNIESGLNNMHKWIISSRI